VHFADVTDLLSSLGLAVARAQDHVFTGSIGRNATRRYFVYSEADFEVFRQAAGAGATRCTGWGEIWHGGQISAPIDNG